MRWINPKERLPNVGEEIAVLIYHKKSHWPQSAQIYFGIVSSIYGKILTVVNNNYMGVGEIQWHFKHSDIYETVSAWCYSNTFHKPDFINKDISKRLKNKCQHQ